MTSPCLLQLRKAIFPEEEGYYAQLKKIEKYTALLSATNFRVQYSMLLIMSRFSILKIA